ncbi:hypothetical protein EYF80_061168 [Liparis tanakae]|uniref:Uncharacterized protein n=1 Tax=Liparis tanakae TaxID=230148 RepID=A0A4Z2EJS0_9TELE|nr:hypothetical protein EYF80_061168 [Liparis tanakae]
MDAADQEREINHRDAETLTSPPLQSPQPSTRIHHMVHEVQVSSGLFRSSLFRSVQVQLVQVQSVQVQLVQVQSVQVCSGLFRSLQVQLVQVQSVQVQSVQVRSGLFRPEFVRT